MNAQKGALTVKQVATLTGVSESAVRRWIGHKQLPAMILPGSKKQPIIRVLRSDFDKFMEARRSA